MARWAVPDSHEGDSEACGEVCVWQWKLALALGPPCNLGHNGLPEAHVCAIAKFTSSRLAWPVLGRVPQVSSARIIGNLHRSRGGTWRLSQGFCSL